ncbi:hypothetical protein HN51_062287 [Arachis hypogaea]
MVRKAMRDTGVEKMPGVSFIEVNNKVYEFIAGDKSGIYFVDICDVLHNINGQLKMVPGIVFAIGPAMTVLILLESDGETYAVLTEQAKVPTGRIILELPAGMLDDDKGDFVGNAVEEEIGIKLKLEDMVDLTTFLDSSTGCGFFPSPVYLKHSASTLLLYWFCK